MTWHPQGYLWQYKVQIRTNTGRKISAGNSKPIYSLYETRREKKTFIFFYLNSFPHAFVISLHELPDTNYEQLCWMWMKVQHSDQRGLRKQRLLCHCGTHSSLADIFFVEFKLQNQKSEPIKHTQATVACRAYFGFNNLKPTGYVMHQQFNIQQLYALSTLYLCVLYLSENKQRLVPLTA